MLSSPTRLKQIWHGVLAICAASLWLTLCGCEIRPISNDRSSKRSSDAGSTVSKSLPTPGATGTATASPELELFKTSLQPLLLQHCAGCHSPESDPPVQPQFAQREASESINIIKQSGLVDSANPTSSRFIARLREQLHQCWDDCMQNAAEMEKAVRAFLAK